MKTVTVDNARLKSLRTAGRRGRTALVLGAAGGLLLVAGCSSADLTPDAAASNPAAAGATTATTSAGTAGTAAAAGGVTLSAASGSTSSTPTWSTSTGCATGFQGSAIFREVQKDGVSTNSISPATNLVTGPIKGTLLANIATIQETGGIPNGGTQKLVVVCFAGASLTQKYNQEMAIYITYSADGKTYTTSTTHP